MYKLWVSLHSKDLQGQLISKICTEPSIIALYVSVPRGGSKVSTYKYWEHDDVAGPGAAHTWEAHQNDVYDQKRNTTTNKKLSL